MFSDTSSMKITLTVTRIAGNTPTQSMSVTFDEQGGTIGRRNENAWVLPDPERFVSGRHALIDFSDQAFHLTDLSSNGVFVNHNAQPVGKNNRVALQDVDILTIGNYEIGVTPQKPIHQVLQSNGFEGQDDPFAKKLDESAGLGLEEASTTSPEEIPQVDPVIEEQNSLEEPEKPSLETEDSPLGIAQSSQSSQADHTSGLNAGCHQPTLIPEDWHLDEADGGHGNEQQIEPPPKMLPPLESTPVPPNTPAIPDNAESLPSKERTPQPRVNQESIPRQRQRTGGASPISPQPPQQTRASSTSASVDEATLRQALAQGMRIPESQFVELPMTVLLESLGQVLRTSVSGTMSILRARAQMKGEFRLSQTMIQPVENNPLKFSINLEEALRHIINTNPSSGYLTPLISFEEAHKDIEAHMLAVMVGMQAAFQVVLQRFKPEILEERLGQPSLLKKLTIYKQAKTWELFTQLYTEIANEAEDDFHQLFGHTFSQAYEAQIQRLELLKPRIRS